MCEFHGECSPTPFLIFKEVMALGPLKSAVITVNDMYRCLMWFHFKVMNNK
jgi:hypothetical protein